MREFPDLFVNIPVFGLPATQFDTKRFKPHDALLLPFVSSGYGTSGNTSIQLKTGR
jgi:hypothetical protein